MTNPVLAQSVPVAHWSFDEPGAIAFDQSGNGLDASLEGSPQRGVPGQQGGAIAFDGVDDLLEVAPSPLLDLTDGLTLSLWLRPAGSGHQMLVSKDGSYELEIGLEGEGRLGLRLNNQTVGAADTAVQPDRWQHVAVTLDGTTVRYFRNGLPDGQRPFDEPLAFTATPLGLGARPAPAFAGGPVFWFEGLLDDGRLYGEALGATEIAELFEASVTDIAPPKRTLLAPIWVLPGGTSTTTISLATDEPSTCRFGATQDTPFAALPSALASSEGLQHQATVADLTDASVLALAVRCRDALGNTNTTDQRVILAVSSGVDLEHGLLAHWPLDDGEGCLADDRTGNGHVGVLSPDCPTDGPLWIPSPRGQALTFAGGEQQVVVSPAVDLDQLDALTFTAWIRHPSTVQYRAIVDKRNAGTDGFDLYLAPGSRPFLRVNEHTLTAGQGVAPDTWTHVAGVYDGAFLELYLDGFLDSRQWVGPTTVTTSAPLRLGHHFTTTPAFSWLGDLDEARLYERPLSAVEVAALVWFSDPPGEPGTVVTQRKLSDLAGGFDGMLDNDDQFGYTVANLGDLDGDGIPEIAVGAPEDDDGGSQRGAVWILFLEADGTVKHHQKISQSGGSGGGLGLSNFDHFGSSLAAIGDLDGDGITELAVGAKLDDDGGDNRGAVWILFLQANGRAKGNQKLSDLAGGLDLDTRSDVNFGSAVAGIGDLDGDGVPDLAVGADRDNDGAFVTGAVYVLFLQPDGTIKAQQKISALEGGLTGTLRGGDLFGSALANLGDLDGDGRDELAVGADHDDDGGGAQSTSNVGAVWILYLEADGNVRAHQKISQTQGGFGGSLETNDFLGSGVTAVGDLDGDGVTELAVGARGTDVGTGIGALDQGAVWILFLAADATVRDALTIHGGVGGLDGVLERDDLLGRSVAHLGDLDGDGLPEVAVGAPGDDDGGSRRGAVWLLSLQAAP